MNNMIKNLVKNGPTGVVSVLSAVAMLAVAGVANAASIVMTPNPASGNVGDPIVVDISGVGWVAGEAAFDAFGAPVLTSAGSTGGGLIVSWDNSIVNLSGGVTGGLNMTFPGSQDFAFDPANPTLTLHAPDIDGNTASLAFDVTSFQVPTQLEDFAIATLTFDAVDPGSTQTALTLATFALWPDGDFVAERELGTSLFLSPTTINVSAVPVPAAVWLFGSGLLGLVGVARRRS